MTREIIEHSFVDQPLEISGPLDHWLRLQARQPSLLLAHAIDGVIWGRVNQDELITSHDVAGRFSPPLRAETLQQLRLFNPDFEVRLWRNDSSWSAVRISDVASAGAAAIDERHLLWGTHAAPLAEGFTKLREGSQGMVHVIPPFDQSHLLDGNLSAGNNKKPRRVYIQVRHYLTEDQLGVNTVTMSRLMGLGVI